MKKIIITTIIVILSLLITVVVSAGSDSLPKGVKKFQDEDITCYTYYKSISCLHNPQPKITNAGSGVKKTPLTAVTN